MWNPQKKNPDLKRTTAWWLAEGREVWEGGKMDEEDQEIQISILAMAIRQAVKGTQIGKEEVKLTIFRWHDTLHREPRRLHRKLLELIKWIQQSSRVQKCATFLYTNNDISGRES